MKTANYFQWALVALLLTFIISCKKEEPAVEQTIVQHQNESEPEPTYAYNTFQLTRVTLLKYNESVTWDTYSQRCTGDYPEPDIYAELKDEIDVQYSKTYVYEDVRTLPKIMQVKDGVQSQELNLRYDIEIYDWECYVADPDEFMGKVSFIPAEHQPAEDTETYKTQTLTLYSADSSVVMRAEFAWTERD